MTQQYLLLLLLPATAADDGHSSGSACYRLRKTYKPNEEITPRNPWNLIEIRGKISQYQIFELRLQKKKIAI